MVNKYRIYLYADLGGGGGGGSREGKNYLFFNGDNF